MCWKSQNRSASLAYTPKCIQIEFTKFTNNIEGNLRSMEKYFRQGTRLALQCRNFQSVKIWNNHRVFLPKRKKPKKNGELIAQEEKTKEEYFSQM